MYYFVKVRVDVNKLKVFGQKLQDGSLTTHPLSTYCLEQDPSVGVNIWEVDDWQSFQDAFSQHREFYTEVIEISPVITPQEAMNILIQRMV